MYVLQQKTIIFLFFLGFLSLAFICIHEATHYASCLIMGGQAKMWLFNAPNAEGLVYFGACGVSCSVSYSTVFVRELVAYVVATASIVIIFFGCAPIILSFNE